LIHCHHCHCCVRCRKYWMPIVDPFVVGMPRNFKWPTDQVFRHHCVCRCYSKLITTRWFQWCYCHCSWRSRTLSFAMVHLFGVGDAPANKEVNESSSICTANESRVFFCPHFYGDPVQNLQGSPFCSVFRSKTKIKMRCGLSSCSKKCSII
jgi:hypothetical protein